MSHCRHCKGLGNYALWLAIGMAGNWGQLQFITSSIGFLEDIKQIEWDAGFETYLQFTRVGCPEVLVSVYKGQGTDNCNRTGEIHLVGAFYVGNVQIWTQHIPSSGLGDGTQAQPNTMKLGRWQQQDCFLCFDGTCGQNLLTHVGIHIGHHLRVYFGTEAEDFQGSDGSPVWEPWEQI